MEPRARTVFSQNLFTNVRLGNQGKGLCPPVIRRVPHIFPKYTYLDMDVHRASNSTVVNTKYVRKADIC